MKHTKEYKFQHPRIIRDEMKVATGAAILLVIVLLTFVAGFLSGFYFYPQLAQ